MKIKKCAKQVAEYIDSLSLEFYEVNSPVYDHIGAVITDAILQPGMNYYTVVFPRVQYILKTFPQAKTTIDFWEIISFHGSSKILSWSGSVKPKRLENLTTFLIENGVYTVNALNKWLSYELNIEEISKLSGIGPKTTNYLQKLVGLDEIAVDRHLKRFIARSGVNAHNYAETKSIFEETASILGVSCASLDQAIWGFESSFRKNRNLNQQTLF